MCAAGPREPRDFSCHTCTAERSPGPPSIHLSSNIATFASLPFHAFNFGVLAACARCAYACTLHTLRVHTHIPYSQRARSASLEILLHPSGGFTPQCGGSGRLPFPFVVLCHHDLALSIPIFGLIFNTPWCVHQLLGRVVCVSVCSIWHCIALHFTSCVLHSLTLCACVW